jgi:hypothetical protein
LQLLIALLPDVVVLLLPVGQLVQVTAEDTSLYVPPPHAELPPAVPTAPPPAQAKPATQGVGEFTAPAAM